MKNIKNLSTNESTTIMCCPKCKTWAMNIIKDVATSEINIVCARDTCCGMVIDKL